MPEIKVVDLGISYYRRKQETLVFEHFNAEFRNEKFNVVMGVSGSGKTTLLRAIAGLSKYAGDIFYDDKVMNNVPPYKRNIAYVSQEYALYPHLTVFENVAYPLKSQGASFEEIKGRVYSLLNDLGIADCALARPKYLSGGQQQRVAIARALIKRPELIIFDEPLSNIDEENRTEIRKLIKEMTAAYHVTVIYSTHSVNEALSLFDTLTVIKGDRVLTFDSLDDLKNSEDEAVKEIFDYDQNIR